MFSISILAFLVLEDDADFGENHLRWESSLFADLNPDTPLRVVRSILVDPLVLKVWFIVLARSVKVISRFLDEFESNFDLIDAILARSIQVKDFVYHFEDSASICFLEGAPTAFELLEKY